MSLLGQTAPGQKSAKPPKFGAQADLCRRTECSMCWWRERVSKLPREFTMADLPMYASPTDPKPMGGWKCHAHHEPHLSQGGRDGDTLSLCPPCHHERHQTTAQLFWGVLRLDLDYRTDATPNGRSVMISDELNAFKMALRCYSPNATPAEESTAWKLWQAAWSESKREERREERRRTEVPK